MSCPYATLLVYTPGFCLSHIVNSRVKQWQASSQNVIWHQDDVRCQPPRLLDGECPTQLLAAHQSLCVPSLVWLWWWGTAVQHSQCKTHCVLIPPVPFSVITATDFHLWRCSCLIVSFTRVTSDISKSVKRQPLHLESSEDSDSSWWLSVQQIKQQRQWEPSLALEWGQNQPALLVLSIHKPAGLHDS